MISIKYSTVAIMVIILTSSRPRPGVLTLFAVHAYKHLVPSCVIQEGLIRVVCVLRQEVLYRCTVASCFTTGLRSQIFGCKSNRHKTCTI